MLRTTFFFFLLALVPDRPTTKEPNKTPPDLRGETNWGLVTQEGRAITIDGHPQWYAVGAIRADGKLELLWTHRDDNRPGPGVYSLHTDGITLKGFWGYAGEVTVGKDGELKGDTRADTIYRVVREE